MYKKKLTAWGLLIIMMISAIPISVFADAQTPSRNNSIVNVTVTSTKNLLATTPNVQVQWTGVTNEYKGGDHHATGFYRFIVTDMLNNTSMTSGTVPATGGADQSSQSYIADLGALLNNTNFTSGKLYRLELQPGHNEIVNGITTQRWATTGNAGVTYFITDFNTKMEKEDGKLKITWEYIEGASYDIYYLQANKSTAAEVRQGTTGDGGASIPTVQVTMSREQAAENQETVNGVKRVKYVIENPQPGQIYSAYVVPNNVAPSSVNNYPYANIHQNKEMGSTGPRVAQASTNIDLKVFNVEPNNVRLEWNLPSWITLTKTLLRTEIYKIDEGSNVPDRIGTIYNEGLGEKKDLGYYQYLRPTKNTTFYVKFFIKQGAETIEIETEKVLYVPGQAVDRPLKPQIPEPFPTNISQDELQPNWERYVIPGDDMPYTSTQFKNNTFHVKEANPLSVQVVWNAPKKINSSGNEVIDYDVVYDVYVAKNQNLLDNESLIPVLNNIPFIETVKDQLVLKQNNTTVIGFKALFNQYVKEDNTLASLNANSTYFIKVVAKRSYGDDYITSDPTIVSITIDKDGQIFTPPILAKPPLKLHETTTDSATLRWRTTWKEIFDKQGNTRPGYDEDEKQKALEWNSVVYTGTTTEPYIRFKSAQGLTEHILETANRVNAVKAAVKASAGNDEDYYATHYLDRTVTLGTDSRYEFKVLSYDEVNREINQYYQQTGNLFTIENWLARAGTISEENWQTISPHIPTNNLESDNNNWLEYTHGGLQPNTRYVLLIRAYKVLDDGTRLVQTYPSYVLATTLTDFESPEEVPKTPELNLDTKDDESITVWWLYNNSFNYEIIYSRLDDVSKAKPWPFTISDVPGSPGYVSNGAKASVKITGLSPETTYNIWIRAKQKKGTQESAWSNPVTATTDALGIPAMPTGLGPAAYQSILELGQDFTPIAKDYITVEWIKNSNDTEENTSSQKQYSYVVQFADNPEFLDATVVNTSGGTGGDNGAGNYEILAKNMVKFNNLIANRPYYVKVKTVLTFKDTEGNREIVRESEYTSWVRILTKTSTDEYDGGENDNIVIYPDAIKQDYSKDIWTVEIVDTAKIISEIMKKKDYFFTLKMEKYDNRYDAVIRRLKIPKTVLDTLINQRMELKIVTLSGVYELPAKALQVYTKQYSAKDIVQLDFTKVLDYKITAINRQYPEILLKGEQLDITIRGKTNTTVVKKLDGFLKAKIKLDIPQEYLYKDLFAYTYNFDMAGWQRENYTVDALTDTYIVYSTAVPGIYTVYEKLKIASSSASSYGMRLLANKYGISALGTLYFQNEIVHSDQYMHLLLGMAQNRSEIDLTAPIYADTRTRARTAGIYTESSSGGITEEQAIAGVVKIYELKTGYKIKPSTVRFNNVGASYQEAVAKAYAIGLIDSINPKQLVRYNTLCDWLLQVTE